MTPKLRFMCRILTLSILTLGLITQGMALSLAPAASKKSRGSAKGVATTGDGIVLEWNEIAINSILPNGPPFTAAHGVLVAYFPGQAPVLDGKRDNTCLATIPAGQSQTDGVAAGVAAAAAMATVLKDLMTNNGGSAR